MARKAASARARPDYFTGKVRLVEAVKMGSREAARAFDVRFYSGARTKLHSHTGPQILIGVAGSGSLVKYARRGASGRRGHIRKVSRMRLVAGSVAHIKAGELHTHGSTSASRMFAHIAINLPAPSGAESAATWYDSDLSTSATRIS